MEKPYVPPAIKQGSHAARTTTSSRRILVYCGIQDVFEANARQQLGLIHFHKTETTYIVIADGLPDNTAPRDRLAI